MWFGVVLWLWGRFWGGFRVVLMPVGQPRMGPGAPGLPRPWGGRWALAFRCWLLGIRGGAGFCGGLGPLWGGGEALENPAGRVYIISKYIALF